MISITDNAVQKLKEFVEPWEIVRLAVEGGGCKFLAAQHEGIVLGFGATDFMEQVQPVSCAHILSCDDKYRGGRFP